MINAQELPFSKHVALVRSLFGWRHPTAVSHSLDEVASYGFHGSHVVVCGGDIDLEQVSSVLNGNPKLTNESAKALLLIHTRSNIGSVTLQEKTWLVVDGEVTSAIIQRIISLNWTTGHT